MSADSSLTRDQSIFNYAVTRRTVSTAADDRACYAGRARAAHEHTCYLCGYPLAADRRCVNDECTASDV